VYIADEAEEHGLATAQGLCAWDTRRILINSECTRRQRDEALLHEIMHAFWGKTIPPATQERALSGLESRGFFASLLDRFGLKLPPEPKGDA
jgi:hypothetical protein